MAPSTVHEQVVEPYVAVFEPLSQGVQGVRPVEE